jgi:hypothetical protein
MLYNLIIPVSVTPWSKTLLENMAVDQHINKIKAFYGTRLFATMLIRFRS